MTQGKEPLTMPTKGRRVCWALASVMLSWSVQGAAQPSNDDVMARATRYVDDFIRQFAGVVAEERYIQEVAPPKQRRELKSEFLLVNPPNSTDWYQFRDVIEVDGRPVRDRQDRLTQLFVTPTTDALKRAAQVTQESARYNITDFGTLNKPLTVLSFLQSHYRARFRFSPGRIDTKVGPTARLVQFRELRVPTLLLRNGFPNLLASGRLWI